MQQPSRPGKRAKVDVTQQPGESLVATANNTCMLDGDQLPSDDNEIADFVV